MRDHPDDVAITYARACEILGITPGNLRVMVHRGRFTKCPRLGYLLEAEVLEVERTRRVAVRKAG